MTDTALDAALVYASFLEAVETCGEDEDAADFQDTMLDAGSRLLGELFDAPDLPSAPKKARSRMVSDWRPNFETWGDAKMREKTRFSLAEIRRLTTAMQIPPVITTYKRDKFSGEEALIILLTRLSYPNRLCDLEDIFHRRPEQLSRIINETLEIIYNKWHHLLDSFQPTRFSPEVLEKFARALSNANCPFDDLCGFLDAVIYPVARPGDDQGVLYNGYPKCHCYKLQCTSAPDGIIIHCAGPIEGRRADGALLAFSGLEEFLKKHAYGYGGRPLFLYGDPAYGETDTVISGLKKVNDLSPEEQDFNHIMAQLRESVEWGLGKVLNYWQYLDFKRSLSSHLSPVGMYFLVAVLFTNAHTTLHGSQGSHFFQLAPPSLEEYFVQYS